MLIIFVDPLYYIFVTLYVGLMKVLTLNNKNNHLATRQFGLK